MLLTTLFCSYFNCGASVLNKTTSFTVFFHVLSLLHKVLIKMTSFSGRDESIQVCKHFDEFSSQSSAYKYYEIKVLLTVQGPRPYQGSTVVLQPDSWLQLWFLISGIIFVARRSNFSISSMSCLKCEDQNSIEYNIRTVLEITCRES